MPLIVSTFGDAISGGGLFSVEGSLVERLDRIGTTGMAFNGRYFARNLRCAPDRASLTEIVIYDKQGVLRYMRLDQAAACHDIAWDGDDLLVVSTWHNAARWFSAAGEMVREVVLPGQVDSCHLNCVARHDGVWYATLFGRFETFRAFAEASGFLAKGEIINLETGETVVSGLAAPHSPRYLDGMWLVCNSQESELRAIDAVTGEIVQRVDCGYWTRGLTWDDSFFYVGGCQRRRDGQSFGAAQIIVISRQTWKPVDRIPIPSQEIYDLVWVPSEFEDAIRRGFDTNPTRTSEFRQYRILTELGNEQPRALWPSGDPLPWNDFRCELACPLPQAARPGEMFELTVKVANRSTCFFTSAPPAPVYLSYKWLDPQTGQYLDRNRAYRSPLPRTIFPRETIDAKVTVVTPFRPGPAILRLTLIQEGVSWFDEQDSGNGIEQMLVIAG